MAELEISAEAVRGYVDYLRDLGIFDLYRTAEPSTDEAMRAWLAANAPAAMPAAQRPPAPIASAVPLRSAEKVLTPFEQARQRSAAAASPTRPPTRANVGPQIVITPPSPATGGLGDAVNDAAPLDGIFSPEMPAPTPFNKLAPLPQARVSPSNRAAALQVLRAEIGDCTRCPLAYAGRHNIVFADGSPTARLMFVGEGPGADEDASGLPFVGKAGQLLNNMIQAMGLQRDAVYIANIVKCRPPKNRVPEPVEANTCSQFLIRQIDIVQPEVIVALGSTAATYLLGVKQSLSALRGNWFDVRGAKCAVTYHPAFLLRDPRQKGEAWKDLQRVMVELKLKPPARA